MNICCSICNNGIFSIIIWGILMILLLLMSGFIRVGTWGNFNCGFSQWNSNVSFDSINLLVVFVVFEIEVVVVIMIVSGVILSILLVVTLLELIVLYQ